MKLWFTFWGKEGGWDTTRQVIRGFDPIDDFLLPHVVPAECDVMIKPGVVDNCWYLESESIFIRSEDKETEEFAVSVCGAARRNRALMVTGQPGIGSSLSISPSLTQVLSSFIRKIHLSSPSALAPSYIQTSHRAAGRPRLCHAFLQRWCEGIFTAQERTSLQLAPTEGRWWVYQKDLGSRGLQPGTSRTNRGFPNGPLFRRQSHALLSLTFRLDEER